MWAIARDLVFALQVCHAVGHHALPAAVSSKGTSAPGTLIKHRLDLVQGAKLALDCETVSVWGKAELVAGHSPCQGFLVCCIEMLSSDRFGLRTGDASKEGATEQLA